MRMRRLVKQKRGQFIVIAALMVAIMMVSIGAIMYGAVTYFRYERWEEYLAIIDNVRLGSSRVVEMSLASYTVTLNNETLKNNLDQWQSNVTKAYPGFGLALTYSNATLASNWYNNTSFSAANATFKLNITSVGLTGYEFTAPIFLRVKIFNATYDDNGELSIYLTVSKEELAPITNLKKGNFLILINGVNPTDFTLTYYYDVEKYQSFIYKIYCQNVTDPSIVSVTITDFRSITVIANTTNIT